MIPYLFYAYAAACCVMSIVTFAAYGWDKRQAKMGGDRVSEKSLHIMGLLCGWPGALAGQRFFRHKTKKLSFRVVLWAIVALHLVLLAGMGWALVAATG